MAKIIKVFTTLRNNWKKSTLGFVLGYFGIDYLIQRERSFMMMREYCREANQYGIMPLPYEAKNKHITLILNPTAGNRKGKTKFEKFAEPILQLSGFLVSIVKTEKVSEAQELAKLINDTNIIAIAGGDGTLFEVVTGLLRRDDSEEAIRRFPLAVIPIGGENEFAKSIFHRQEISEPKMLAESAMAVVKHKIEPKDVIEIKLVEAQTPGTPVEGKDYHPDKQKKPFYSMTGLVLGQFREAQKAMDSLPNFLGKNFGTFWSHMRKGQPVNFKAEIRYLSACEGCKKCRKVEPIPPRESYLTRAYRLFWPTSKVYAAEIEQETMKENPECGIWNEICVECCEFNIKPNGNGTLRMEIGERAFGRFGVIAEGFRRLKGQPSKISQKITISEAQIIPIQFPEFLSIDNEDFEMKPLYVKCLREKLHFFTKVSE